MYISIIQIESRCGVRQLYTYINRYEFTFYVLSRLLGGLSNDVICT